LIKYAILADHARVDGDAAHLLGASHILVVPRLPTARPFALLIELMFTEEQCGSEHSLSISSRAPSGLRHLELQVRTRPEWPIEPPPGGLVRVALAINGLLPVVETGDHRIELTLDDGDPYLIDYRIVVPPAADTL
jgi:hypothetical protein